MRLSRVFCEKTVVCSLFLVPCFLHRGEFSILHDRNPVAYQAAGLSFDTKFDLKQTVVLPYSTEWFSVPPAAPHGQKPALGTLHPSLVRAIEAAFRATKA